jgi:Bacterial type II and III secretion system protein
MSLLLALVLAVPANKDATLFRCDVAIYQGNPAGSKEKGDIQVLSSPQLITRSGQDALISVGQQVSIVTDIKREKELITNTVTQTQVGIILRMTPKQQSDGTIVVSSKVILSQVIDKDTIKEETVSTCRVHQPGETLKVPFYNPSTCRSRASVPFLGLPMEIVKYAGNEVWMDVKITPMKESDLKP